MKNVVTRVTRCKMHRFPTGSWNFAWLLVGYSFMLCCSCLMQLLIRYPIKEDTDLDKNCSILPERYYFFLHL